MRPITQIAYLYNIKKIMRYINNSETAVTFHPNYNYNRKTHRSFKGMEINLPNNTAWKKSEPPRLSYNSDTKMKYEMWTPQGEPLPTLKEIETSEETSTHDVKMKKSDEYV